MKKITTLLLIIGQLGYSQFNIKITSLDNGGGTAKSGPISVVSTIGEVSINEYSANTIEVSEGFIGKHQLNNQASQNLDCVTPPHNLISWWAAEDNANDLVGGNHGTSNGATYATGSVNKAFLFDGVDDVVVIPASESLDITGDITVELWAVQTVFNSENTVVCKGAQEEPTVFSMRFSGATLNCAFQDTAGANIDLGGPSFEDFQWHHYVYVRKGNQHTIYADGFNFGWVPFTNPPASSAGLPLTIGAQYDNQNKDYVNYFGGQIDEVSVYNRALSETEIQSIYNAGANGKCEAPLNIEDDSFVENTIKFYPNPVIDTLIINFNKLGSFNVSLYDVSGKILNSINNSSNKAQIQMSNQAPGLYFVAVQNQENQQTKVFKILKK
ncbi:LamG-like jellyroll fold domain-containing protein [uncultured Algibacter sp.]|uniref:LamG-like jellyroll fold domain-containing protein n=1 Tax=uncultured Algibacter sp. TaxID=298659 RepID=UPI00261A133F|nr:LamG-like jellyroll fold domain-containing protein [uncultured Algibacter sp.]